jgi:hypothetical protein
VIEIKITEKSPLDALASLTALGIYCQGIGVVKDAAKCILEQDARKDTHAPNTDAAANASASVQPPVIAPTPQQQAAPAAAPVAAPAAYTLEQLQHAAGELVRTNKREALTALLAQFSIPSLIQLPKEQYGAFATALRGIGAMI